MASVNMHELCVTWNNRFAYAFDCFWRSTLQFFSLMALPPESRHKSCIKSMIHREEKNCTVLFLQKLWQNFIYYENFWHT